MSNLCAICLDVLSGCSIEETILSCSHTFHASCINPWLSKKGTCAVCRFQVCPSNHEDDENEEEQSDIEMIRAAVLEYWRRRFPSLQSLEQLHTSVHPEPQPYTQPYQTNQNRDIQQNISIVDESDEAWIYTVNGVLSHESKRNVNLVLDQTNAELPTCLYALYKYDGDVINAILDISDNVD